MANANQKTSQEVYLETVQETLQGTVQETAKGTVQETSKRVRKETPVSEQIIVLMRGNPCITMKELAEKIGVSSSGVKYHINLLKERGRIIRKGPTKSGVWLVLK